MPLAKPPDQAAPSPSVETPRAAESSGQPLSIEYMDLLKTHGHPDAQAVREFLDQHRDDQVFQARAQVLNRAFLIGQLIPQQPTTAKAKEQPVGAGAGRP